MRKMNKNWYIRDNIKKSAKLSLTGLISLMWGVRTIAALPDRVTPTRAEKLPSHRSLRLSCLQISVYNAHAFIQKKNVDKIGDT